MQQIIDTLRRLARTHQPPFREAAWQAAVRDEFQIRHCDFKNIKTYTQIIDFGHGNNHGSYYAGRRSFRGEHFQNLHRMLRSLGLKPPEPPDEISDLSRWRDWLVAVLGALAEAGRTQRDGTVPAMPQRAATRLESSAFPPPGRVIGREQTVAALSAAAITADAPILVLGGPGFGKTTVAVAVAHAPDVAARFARRRWFVPLDDVSEAAAMRERVASRIGLDPRASERALLDELDRAPGLLVLDNLETPWEPAAGRRDVERLLHALAGLPNLALLVTMRGHEAPADLSWTQEHLPPLTRRAARELFLDEARTIRTQDPLLFDFLGALGGIPLAVRLVALRANGRVTLAALWREWQAVGVALAARLQTDLDRLSSLEISIALSLRSPRLSLAGRTAFALLGQLPSGLAAADQAELLAPRGHAGPGELLTLGLAREQDDRLDLLPPLRDYARRSCLPPDEAMRQWIRHYLHLVADLGDRVGTRQGQDASRRLQPESANIEAAFAAAPDHALLDTARAVAPGFARAARLARFGSVATLERLAAASRDTASREQAAGLLLALGELAGTRAMRETAMAAFTDGLALFEDLRDPLGQARCHRGLGDILMSRSLSAAARQRYEQALTLLDPDGLDAADIIAQLGHLESDTGNETLGRRHLTAARTLYETTVGQTGELLGWAHCVFRLAEMDRLRGAFDAARHGYRQTEELCARGGLALGHANASKGLGDIALQEGQLQDAVRLFAYARKRYHRLGSINNEGNALRGLGDVAAARASTPRARQLWRAALRRYALFENPLNIGTIHVRLARTSTGDTRLAEVGLAERAWLGVGRADLVARYLVPLRERPHAPADTFEGGPF